MILQVLLYLFHFFMTDLSHFWLKREIILLCFYSCFKVVILQSDKGELILLSAILLTRVSLCPRQLIC